MSERLNIARKNWYLAYQEGVDARAREGAINPYRHNQIGMFCAWQAGFLNY
jgi:hypothetical protein